MSKKKNPFALETQSLVPTSTDLPQATLLAAGLQAACWNWHCLNVHDGSQVQKSTWQPVESMHGSAKTSHASGYFIIGIVDGLRFPSTDRQYSKKKKKKFNEKAAKARSLPSSARPDALLTANSPRGNCCASRWHFPTGRAGGRAYAFQEKCRFIQPMV